MFRNTKNKIRMRNKSGESKHKQKEIYFLIRTAVADISTS